MRFTLEYPSETPCAADDFLRPDVLREVALAAESAGFHAIALSEHPAPSVKWRENGGHNTIDPITALSYLAGVTTAIHLMTNLFVLPFRNPYLAAQSLTTLDVISDGRLIAGVGAGYLRSEFSALGVDYDSRATRFDEALCALTSIWADPNQPVRGADFEATGPVSVPRPVQRPGPPLWIGGNGPAALRRVVQHGRGWMPIIGPAAMAAAIRTHPIEDPDHLAAAVDRLHARFTDAGRDPATLDVQVVLPPFDIGDPAAIRRACDQIEQFAAAGATWAVVHVDAATPRAAIDDIQKFSEIVSHTT